jgi:hypothetical protein
MISNMILREPMFVSQNTRKIIVRFSVAPELSWILSTESNRGVDRVGFAFGQANLKKSG